MRIHIAQENDTLLKLSKKYQVNFDKLLELNSSLEDPNKIAAGTKIKIPSKGVAFTPKKKTTTKLEAAKSEKSVKAEEVLENAEEVLELTVQEETTEADTQDETFVSTEKVDEMTPVPVSDKKGFGTPEAPLYSPFFQKPYPDLQPEIGELPKPPKMPKMPILSPEMNNFPPAMDNLPHQFAPIAAGALPNPHGYYGPQAYGHHMPYGLQPPYGMHGPTAMYPPFGMHPQMGFHPYGMQPYGMQPYGMQPHYPHYPMGMPVPTTPQSFFQMRDWNRDWEDEFNED